MRKELKFTNFYQKTLVLMVLAKKKNIYQTDKAFIKTISDLAERRGISTDMTSIL